MGRRRSGAVFHLGVIGDSAATLDYLYELGKIMIHKMLALPLLILMGSFVMAEDTPQTLFDFTGSERAAVRQ